MGKIVFSQCSLIEIYWNVQNVVHVVVVLSNILCEQVKEELEPVALVHESF